MSTIVLKKFLTYLIGLLLAFLVIDRAASAVLDRVIRQSEFRFSKIYRGGLDAEILVLGNSRAVNAFHAPTMEKELGVGVFNLGYNGMSMQLCESVFRDYLNHNDAPKVLLIEVTNLGDGNDHLKEQKMYRGLSRPLAALLRSEMPLIDGTCRLSRLYQYNCEMFLRCFHYMNQSDQDWINNGKMTAGYAESLEIEPWRIRNAITTDGPGRPALQRILALCEEQGIEVKLIISPYFPKYAEALTDFAAWKTALQNQLPQPGILYDFSTSLTDYRSFADILHINLAGSARLLEQMKENGLFVEFDSK
jgi:hypothetical protein